MAGFLTDDIHVSLVQAPLADGQTDPDSDSVDMSGYDGCLFLGIVGDVTGSGTAKIEVEQSEDDSSFDALASASATASGSDDSDKLLGVDVYPHNPENGRYLRTALTRATANSVWGGTLAIRYKARSRPVAQTAAQWAASLVQVAFPDES